MKKYIKLITNLSLVLIILISLTGCTNSNKEKIYLNGTYKIESIEIKTNKATLLSYEKELIDKLESFITFGKYKEIITSEESLKDKTELEKNAFAVGFLNYIAPELIDEKNYSYKIIDLHSRPSVTLKYYIRNDIFYFDSHTKELYFNDCKINATLKDEKIEISYYGYARKKTLLFVAYYTKVSDDVISTAEYYDKLINR